MNFHEIEAAVCGMVMREPRHLAEAVTAGVSPDHFTHPFHADLFEACVAAWGVGKPTDVVTLCHKLGHDKRDEVARIRSQAPPTVNFAPYAQALLDNRRHMELHGKLGDLSRALASRRPMDPLTPIIEAIGGLIAFSGAVTGLRTTDIREALDRSLMAAEERMSAKGTPGIPTGFELLDRTFYGFQPGFMYVLGARTAVGKTTMATTMAVNAARAGYKTAVVTVEMADTDLADKMLMRISRVSANRYLSGTMSSDEMDRIVQGATELAELPLFFTEVTKPSFDLLAFEILRLVKVEGVKLVVIDYLQLFETGDGAHHRNAREDAKLVSARLKLLARSLKVPILVLSQLNRQAPEDGEPELIHIAETDQIARDADVVMFLYRWNDEYYLSVAKQRRGQRRAFRLRAELQHSCFEQGEVTNGR